MDEFADEVLAAAEARRLREFAEETGDVTHNVRHNGVPNLLDHGNMLFGMLVERLGGEVFLSDSDVVAFSRRQKLTMVREMDGVRVTLTDLPTDAPASR